MIKRWLRVELLAGIVFAINVVGRLVVRIGSIEDADGQQLVALLAFLAIGVAMAVAAVLWTRQRAVSDVATDLAGGGFAGGLLCLLLGPFVGGSTPAADGLEVFLAQAGLYAAYAGGGAGFGILLVIALGKDYVSQSLAQFAEKKLSKPRRPVRG